MATELGAASAWDIEFSSVRKSLDTLFSTLVMHASGNADLNEKVKKLTEQSSMWRNSFAEEHAEKEALKVEQRLLAKQVATLTEENGRLEKENILLKTETLRLATAQYALTKQVDASRHSDTSNQFSVVLIDGDGLIFDDSFLIRGQEGGREAAQLLRKSVQKQLGPQQSDASIRVHIFMNKVGLAKVLQEANVVPAETFDQFLKAFQSAHSSTAVVDVGPGKEAADAKIRDEISFCIGLSQCKLIVLGCSHDNGYGTVLRSLKTEGRMDNVRILKGYRNLAQELQEFNDSVMEIRGLFRLNKINTSPRTLAREPTPPVTPTTACAVSDNVTFSAVAKSGTISALSPVEGSMALFKPVSPRPLQDRSNLIKVKSIRELEPRPCHAQYLRDGCTKPDCPYGHNYKLTTELTAELAELAKKLPCEGWLNDTCFYTAETCIYGHVCPRGSTCLRAMCFFKKWHDQVKRI